MRQYRFFCLIFLMLLAGCGGSGNVPLKGTVTFSDDGSPVPLGVVSFLKDGKIATGMIKENGTYIVGFEKDADGLPPGNYQVSVIAERSIELEPGSGHYRYEQLIDKKYARPETSELSVEVNAATKTFDIQVDRFVGRR